MEIVVNAFRREDGGDVARVACAVRSEGMPDTLWFETPLADAGAIDTDEPNWAATALLFPAMMLGRDLVIEAALSPRLLFGLQHDLQEVLSLYEPRLNRIKVRAGTSDPAGAPAPGTRIATGFSAGVDTFATLALHGAAAPAGARITDLAVFNVGALGRGEIASLHRFFRDRAHAHAGRNGWGTYFVHSNLETFYHSSEPNFQRTHTLRSMSAALLLQREVGTYLYSAGMPYHEIKAGPSLDMCGLDPILLPLLSTERMTLRSGAAFLSRGQKTALIADDPDAQAMLDVCVAYQPVRMSSPKLNCSVCWKCTRTMLTLEAIGKLDAFGEVFDLATYRANRPRLLRTIRSQADNGNRAALEAFAIASSHGLYVPPSPGPMRKLLSNVKRSLANVQSGVVPTLRAATSRSRLD